MAFAVVHKRFNPYCIGLCITTTISAADLTEEQSFNPYCIGLCITTDPIAKIHQFQGFRAFLYFNKFCNIMYNNIR